ncbi:MAG TPA: NRDE family protein [Thermoanaerobaculaceae bacterium]|nr:NRDE family protein [Thermoanaerobaculaceae bacterium]
MCILVALRRDREGGELWLGANRDERLDRPWESPRLLLDEPPVFAGRDLVGGGSWLAVNLEGGFVVGVTNARRGARPGPRSRGALVVDLAAQPSLPSAVALLSELELGNYGRFNLMLADIATCWLATNDPAARIERAVAPVAAIGNDPLGAPGERVVAAADRAAALAGEPGPALAAALEELLADHRGEDPLCRHGETYGTVCSTVLGIRGGALVAYRFAPGPPCTTPFESLAPAPRPRPH